METPSREAGRFHASITQACSSGSLSARYGTSYKRKPQHLIAGLPGISEIAVVRIVRRTSGNSARPTELNQFDTFPVKRRRDLHSSRKQRAGILLVNQPRRSEVLE